MKTKTIQALFPAFLISVLLAMPARAQDMPADAPAPKAIAAKPADVCANLQKEWAAASDKSKQALADEGSKLCADGKYAEGALKLRQALGK